MSRRRQFAVFGTDLDALLVALEGVLGSTLPDDRVRVRLVLAPDCVRVGLRDAWGWSCADRIREVLARHGRTERPVVVFGRAAVGLEAMIESMPRCDVLVLSDSWSRLLADALALGPDVWLWPKPSATCSLDEGAAVPSWFVPSVEPGMALYVAPTASVMEQLRRVQRMRGQSLVLPGPGAQPRTGWWDWFREVRAAG
ncbi:MAG: hypothetical protein EP330_14140 [Deltaproteobacteria bacterium]|nr:MAG: hypothetical protein EP330_14140 [Deltaproteobacteria bacterium]